MKFMLMMNAPKGTGEWGVVEWAADDFKAHVEFMHRFGNELKQAGELVAAEGLSDPRHARIVHAGSQGEPVVTDGPFAEGREFLAGYWIVEVETEARAYEIAAEASAAPGPGGKPLNMPIEVREIISAPGPSSSAAG